MGSVQYTVVGGSELQNAGKCHDISRNFLALRARQMSKGMSGNIRKSQKVGGKEKAAMGADDESIADGRADVVMGRFLRARQLWGVVGNAPTHRNSITPTPEIWGAEDPRDPDHLR